MDREPIKLCISSLSFKMQHCEGTGIDNMKPCYVQLYSEEPAVLTASEDEWPRRIRHRHFAVACIKRSSYYAASLGSVGRPHTPDAEDREVSKRTWEKSVQDWREHLKSLQLCMELR